MMEVSKAAFWPREDVAERFTVSTTTLLCWERRGLVRAIRSGDREGYGPTEIRRLWTILTFRRDLGINLAGVDVILQLRDEMRGHRARLAELAGALRETLDEAEGPDEFDG